MFRGVTWSINSSMINLARATIGSRARRFFATSLDFAAVRYLFTWKRIIVNIRASAPSYVDLFLNRPCHSYKIILLIVLIKEETGFLFGLFQPKRLG